MRTRMTLMLLAVLAGSLCAQSPIRVLLVTGGHPYDTTRFDAMFASFKRIQLTVLPIKTGTEIFEDIRNWNYDVLILYNKDNPGDALLEKHKQNFLALLDRGVGLLCLHHATNSYPFWPEYAKIIGVTYRSPSYFKTNLSTFVFPGPLTMTNQDTLDPVMRGVPKTFILNDEMYGNVAFEPGNKNLLKVSDPSTEGPLAWSRTYRNAKVFTTLLGHGPGSFDNPGFRTMMANAIAAISPCPGGGGGCMATGLGKIQVEDPVRAGLNPPSPGFRFLPGGFNILGVRRIGLAHDRVGLAP